MTRILSTSLENAEQAAAHQARLSSTLDLAFVTDRGGREENQDCCGYGRAADGSWVFAVADGLGGHHGGRMAAQMAMEGVLERVANPGFSFEATNLMEVFVSAQASIVGAKTHRPDLAKMRSTLMVLVIKDGLACWGHVGDVRLYHLRRGEIVFQTRDQSVPQMLVDMGEIKPDEIRKHPDRGRLLHALGKEGERFRMVQLPGPVQLEKGDVLHLCTDGFWEWVDEKELEKAVSEREKAGDILQGMVTELRERAARDEPEYDNYTALTLRVGDVRRNEAFRHKTRFVRHPA